MLSTFFVTPAKTSSSLLSSTPCARTPTSPITSALSAAASGPLFPFSQPPPHPYLGVDLKDDAYLIGDYLSAVSHSTSRGMSIDHKHPVYIKGIPYIPVYGAGNTSLYYIGNTSSSVTLAIVAAR